MAFVVKDRVKETSTTTGTGTLTLAGAVSGFQAFSVVGNGNLCKYTLLAGSESAPTAWERGYGTWSTGGTLARTLVLDNNSGTTSAITLPAGTHTVMLGWGADDARETEVAQHAATPGGRLTLTSGTPVTTSDVTGATSIYYTPYVSNVITLWDGYRWRPIEFSEYTLALGTLTSGKPYDVFAYLSSGVLALEMLAWTNDTTRATAITIQDGRYCKSGDKTRLYLGTFYTTATTTTEDSQANRYLWNMYNRAAKAQASAVGTSHTNQNQSRLWNGGSGTLPRCQLVVGLGTETCVLSATARMNYGSAATINAAIGVWLDGASIGYGGQVFIASNFGALFMYLSAVAVLSVGRHYVDIEVAEYNNSVLTFDNGKTFFNWWA
jgi:hypothetical protein